MIAAADTVKRFERRPSSPEVWRSSSEGRPSLDILAGWLIHLTPRLGQGGVTRSGGVVRSSVSIARTTQSTFGLGSPLEDDPYVIAGAWSPGSAGSARKACSCLTHRYNLGPEVFGIQLVVYGFLFAQPIPQGGAAPFVVKEVQ